MSDTCDSESVNGRLTGWFMLVAPSVSSNGIRGDGGTMTCFGCSFIGFAFLKVLLSSSSNSFVRSSKSANLRLMDANNSYNNDIIIIDFISLPALLRPGVEP